jgi:hypothetical protein
MNAPQDFRHMTADSVGKDLLSALVTEMKLLPKPWPELSQSKQDDIIDRLRDRVYHNIKMAVHLLAAQGRTVVAGDLDQITIKDGVKAVIKFGAGAANLHELYEVSGKAVLVVVANAADHTGGMGEIKGEADQRGIDLGHEYKPGSGGEGMEGSGAEHGDVVEGEVLALSDHTQKSVEPTETELDEVFESGFQGAEDGVDESDCPHELGSKLADAWLDGHRAWHTDNPGSKEKKATKPAVKYRHPNDHTLTWTGRGKKPQWVEFWLAHGGSMSDLDVAYQSGTAEEA